MNRTDRLKAVYAEIPNVKCKGRCASACGLILMSTLEYERLGKPKFESLRCPVLGEDNRCTKYDLRPAICRLWGATEDLPCPYGCEIEGSPVDGAAILVQIKAISPGVKPDIEKFRAVMAQNRNPTKR